MGYLLWSKNDGDLEAAAAKRGLLACCTHSLSLEMLFNNHHMLRVYYIEVKRATMFFSLNLDK